MSAPVASPQAAQGSSEPPAGTERMTYREALRLALREEMARDERVFLMGEEVGRWTSNDC